MLFIFDKPDNYGFWMKDMRFPIDIIWLDQNFKVVHVEKSVATSTYPKVFYPSGPATYVLEVNSGISDSINLQIGDEAKFLKKPLLSASGSFLFMTTLHTSLFIL